MKKVLIFFFFLFLLFLSFRNKSFAIEGCFCGPNSLCYPDGCTRRPINDNNQVDKYLCRDRGCNGAYEACYNTDSIDANRYFCLEQPPCCQEMVNRNDAEACCWPERGYCHPEYCKRLSEPKGCAHYWIWNNDAAAIGWYLRPYGYGCIKGASPENSEPVFGLPKIAGGGGLSTTKPTPTPTKFITPSPTIVITPTPSFNRMPINDISPTEHSFPIDTQEEFKIPTRLPPVVIPTSYFLPSSTPFPSIIPKITPFSYNFQENLSKAIEKIRKNYHDTIFIFKAKVKKVSEPSKKVFFEFIKIDKSIEEYFNEKFLLLIYKNLKSLFST